MNSKEKCIIKILKPVKKKKVNCLNEVLDLDFISFDACGSFLNRYDTSCADKKRD